MLGKAQHINAALYCRLHMLPERPVCGIVGISGMCMQICCHGEFPHFVQQIMIHYTACGRETQVPHA